MLQVLLAVRGKGTVQHALQYHTHSMITPAHAAACHAHAKSTHAQRALPAWSLPQHQMGPAASAWRLPPGLSNQHAHAQIEQNIRVQHAM